jgi:hypothetical protein
MVDQSYIRSPLTPLKKGGIRVKVPLFKGDLGGSIAYRVMSKTFQTSPKGEKGFPGYT